MKISVSSYSYQQYIRAGRMTQLEVVRCAHEMGFAGIDFTELRPCENYTLEDQLAYADKIRQEADKYGVEVVAYTIGANLYQDTDEEQTAEIARMKGQVDVATRLGATLLRHDVCYSEKHNGVTVSFEKMLPRIADAAREITVYAESLGIRTMTENHGLIAQDSDRVERLYNTVDHNNYGILVDIGNFACADEDSIRAVSRLAPYAFHVHAKDFHKYAFSETAPTHAFVTRGCNKLVGCAIGDGDIPTAQCIAILKKAGYDGYLTVEYEGADDCIVGIARGKAFLEKNI